MGWNFKVSTRGMIFWNATKPFTTLIGWGTFLFTIIWSFVQDYSFLKGFFFVAGVQFVMAIVVFSTLWFILRKMEMKWRAESL